MCRCACANFMVGAPGVRRKVLERNSDAAHASYMTRFGHSHTMIVIVDEFCSNF